MNYCPECGFKKNGNENYCPNCGAKLSENVKESNRPNSDEIQQQVRIETIWAQEKTVPKWLRGSWQAKLSFSKLEKGLTDSEKQELKRRRDTQ